MSATQIDPHCALIVIDLQKGIIGFPFAHPIKGVIARTRALLGAFRAAKQTVVLVNGAGMPTGRTEAGRPDFTFPDDWTDLIAELDTQPSDLLVTKHTWGAFCGTGLAETLTALGVTQVVLAGIVTSMGVESTAREAFSNGFNVTLAVDAMTDLTEAVHINSVSNIFPHLGETARTAQIVALLGRACP